MKCKSLKVIWFQTAGIEDLYSISINFVTTLNLLNVNSFLCEIISIICWSTYDFHGAGWCVRLELLYKSTDHWTCWCLYMSPLKTCDFPPKCWGDNINDYFLCGQVHVSSHKFGKLKMILVWLEIPMF